MATKRNIGVAIVAGGVLLALLGLSNFAPVGGQVVQPVPADQPFPGIQPPDGGDPTNPTPKKESSLSAHYGAMDLTTDSEYGQYLAAARDCIKDKVWGDAASAMQAILNNTKDYYVKVVDTDASGQAYERWTSVKYEANKLLGSMPPEGLKVYEGKFGRYAEIQLEQAIKKNDLQLIGMVASQFFHTKAGAQANDLLATYFLDRGQFFVAALQYDRMLTLGSKENKVSPLTLFKATLAFQRAGDIKKVDSTWKRLLPQLQEDGGLKINNQLVAVDKLKNILASTPIPQMISPKDWALVRGNLSNNAQSQGSPPLLGEILWKRPTVRDMNEIMNEYDPDGGVLDQIDKAEKIVKGLSGVPVMPGFFPIAVEGKLIFRNYNGMKAVYLEDLKDAEGKVIEKAGSLAWTGVGFDGSLALTLSNKDTRDKFGQWLDLFRSQHPDFMNFVYENSLIGTLSADLKQVYAVDDVAIPLPPSQVPLLLNTNNLGGISSEIKQRLFQNSLQAYNIHTGKMAWRLGLNDNRKHGDFEESVFLGPPLPVGGRLFVLNERSNGELRLVAVDPVKGEVIQTPQMLGTVHDEARFAHDPNRRVHAVHMAYAEGILVCPTNAGQILGVDLLSRSLAWAYPYREGKQNQNNIIGNPPIGLPPKNMQAQPLVPATWKVAPPAVDSGKVVFTAPDAKSLHCISLRDGIMVWKKPKSESDLFLAGAWNGRVIVVGRNSCYALDLHSKVTPEVLWTVFTGAMPSGQGVCSNNIYYLPLENGEICAIDIMKGAITKNRPASADAKVPGNLVFHEGMVISQTTNEILVYPQLAAKMELVEKNLKKDPGNLQTLLHLGELKLANGQVHDALETLHLVKAKNPPEGIKPRLQQKLYEALTDLFVIDFPTAKSKYLEEYEELCKTPADRTEQEKRQAQLYRLLGNGLEAEGDLVGAFVAYRKFGSLELFQKEGIPDQNDPLRKIPAQVWFRGRIGAMFAKAPPEKRGPLDDKILQEWTKVSKKNDINEIRSFVSMFDASFKVGQLSRLQLANAIIERNDTAAYLEAELNLEQLRAGALGDDPNIGGKALEALARLEMNKRSGDSMKLAANYYRQLSEEFGNVVIRDGKTGKGLFDELATRKVFLPYLEKTSASWGNAQFKVRELPVGSIPANLAGMYFHPKGNLNPHTANLRLVLEPVGNSPKVRLVDLSTNKDVWSEFLDNHQANIYINSFLTQLMSKNHGTYEDAHFRKVQLNGHLAVFQAGTMAYAVDLNKPAIRWKQSLLTENITPGFNSPQVTTDHHNHMVLSFKYYSPFQRTVTMRLGYVAAVQPSYVALVQQDNLLVIDPLSENTPKVFWSRQNISEETEVFGDDQFIYMVDVGSNGVAANGRALRVADGTVFPVANFAPIYQKRLHLLNGRILSQAVVGNQLVLRLYDIPTGKDIWKGVYHADAKVLKTEDPYLTGVIEPDGKMTVVDLKTQKVALESNVLHYRVTKNDVRNLDQPLLLADSDYFYVALNQPINKNQVGGGQLLTNFGNGLRCAQVNGWFGAFHRKDGSKTINDKLRTWKKGDLHWLSSEPINNQLVVVDNFDSLPMIIFSVRFHELGKAGPIPANQWLSKTQSLDKATGKWIHYPFTPRITNGVSPSYNLMTVDAKGGTVNIIGFSGVLQHYIDDGRKQPVNGGGEVGKVPPPDPNQQFGGIIPPGGSGLPPVVIQKLTKLPFSLYKAGSPDLILQVPGETPVVIRPGNPPMVYVPGQAAMTYTSWRLKNKELIKKISK